MEIKIAHNKVWIPFKDLGSVARFLATMAESFGVRAVVAGPDGAAVEPERSL